VEIVAVVLSAKEPALGSFALVENDAASRHAVDDVLDDYLGQFGASSDDIDIWLYRSRDRPEPELFCRLLQRPFLTRSGHFAASVSNAAASGTCRPIRRQLEKSAIGGEADGWPACPYGSV